MMVLKDILYGVPINAVVGSTSTFDSRKVDKGSAFIAIRGHVADGHTFIAQAISHGAIAIICEELPLKLTEGVTFIEVENCNMALAVMASNYYDLPSENLKLVGVTGTNGKTTVATLLYQLFKKAGYKVGLISTVNIMIDDKVLKASHTTPDSISINKYLKDMNDTGVEFCLQGVYSQILLMITLIITKLSLNIEM